MGSSSPPPQSPGKRLLILSVLSMHGKTELGRGSGLGLRTDIVLICGSDARGGGLFFVRMTTTFWEFCPCFVCPCRKIKSRLTDNLVKPKL